MKWYERGIKEVEQMTRSEFSSGLSEEEAKKRLHQFGPNKLDEGESVPAFFLFLAQFKDFMVIVLLVATLISAILGEYIDAVTIIIIVLLNGILGFIQERKAEKSLAALKELSAPQIMVRRDGDWTKVLSSNVVVGDIVKFTSGDRVGADIRIIESKGLRIEESALTGESVPVQKTEAVLSGQNLSVGDQENMAFMGTMVTQGSGIGVIVATGMKTEMGKIAHLLQSAETQVTPLQRKLEQLGKILVAAALLLTALVVIIGVYQGQDAYTMVLAGVSLAVAAIPEGLPAIVTVALALGVQRMIKHKAIVRRLPAVETLGCASVICSDKTGTLTQNKMTVTKLWSGGKVWTVSGTGYEPKGEFYENDKKLNIGIEKTLLQLVSFGALCNNAKIVTNEVKKSFLNKDKLQYGIDGDPTEGALVVCAHKAGIVRENIFNEYKIIEEFPFDSNRKMMSVLVERKRDKKRIVVTKGAPDVLLSHSEHILWDERRLPLSPQRETAVSKSIEELASQALRTIAIAYKEVDSKTTFKSERDVESKLTFIGLQGMIDPPRPEVKDSILECREAGIKTIMITGDHIITAEAIAKQLNILPDHGKIMDGNTLAKMSVQDLEEVVEDIYVYARVSPEHKLKIVKAFQAKGHIVAMTGDGVNDAPAIKAANIGVAMGKTGTDVAKEASSLILSDDNFATIKAAIKEGRNIYDNIRKFIRYMLASNVGEILVMLFAMLLGMPLPLVAIQILWINLVTDGLPAMALGLDQAEADVMKRKPRHPLENVLARGLAWKIISRGFMIGIVTLIAFSITLSQNPEELVRAQTVAFATLIMAQLIHVFDCRSDHSVFHRNPFQNVYLVIAVLSSTALMLVVMYFPPLQSVFHTVSLGMREWLLVLSMASIPTIALAGFYIFRKK